MSMPINERSTELLGSAELSESQRHDLLQSERRRVVIATLAGRDLPLTLDEVATVVATGEDADDEPTPELLKDVRISLHHVHLPKLAEAGLIEYDPTHNRIHEQQTDLSFSTR